MSECSTVALGSLTGTTKALFPQLPAARHDVRTHTQVYLLAEMRKSNKQIRNISSF